MVDSVMVDGRWVMRGQVLLAFDETAALADAEAALTVLHERTAEQLATLDTALPALARALPGIRWRPPHRSDRLRSGPYRDFAP
jgi:hypothetical protein